MSEKSSKDMITYKKLQNLDLNTYDVIFSDRQLFGQKLQDLASFKELLDRIKKQYNPEILSQHNIQAIKEEGKFSLNKYNLTRLKSLNDAKFKNSKMSINNRYIYSDSQFGYFYMTKSIFKGKHCFEIEIYKMANPEVAIGLVDINYIDILKKEFIKLDNNKKEHKNIFKSIQNFDYFNLGNQIMLKQNNEVKIHYLSYGDIIGFCFNLDEKLINICLNGEIISVHELNIKASSNISFVPIISIGKSVEIIFNPGEDLKFGEYYKKMGFIPLDEKNKNNYEISKLKNVTDDYINLLTKDGKSIINNENIGYSDINQIYHDIFEFLGNTSFQHSYIIKNCFIPIIDFPSLVNKLI